MRDAVAEAASEEELPVREKHDFRTFFNSCVWGFGFIRAWVYLMFWGAFGRIKLRLRRSLFVLIDNADHYVVRWRHCTAWC